jgi:hypothetical protein
MATQAAGGELATPASTVAGEAAAPASFDRPLPLAPVKLFGRDADIAELARWVTEDRLVTVLGAGGIGKTQVAQQVRRVGPGPRRSTATRRGSTSRRSAACSTS